MDIRTLIIDRFSVDKTQAVGVATVLNAKGKPIFTCKSLERGWNNNEKMISCVPKGRYTIKLEWSNRFGANLWELKNVPNRSECKLHSANYWNQLNGCIALGLSLRDINGDGEVDATSSRRAMKDFARAMGNATEAEIIIR
tara:strand:+ start:953 stop:1375 length:423 start_codon:yes stop_codon:yes gene_type:complete